MTFSVAKVGGNQLKLCPSDVREESSDMADGPQNAVPVHVSSAPAKLNHLESWLNS